MAINFDCILFPPFTFIIKNLINVIYSLPLTHFIANIGGVHTSQLWRERRKDFLNVIRPVLNKPNVKILEIGTWMAAGSTKLIINKITFIRGNYKLS